MVSDVAAAAAAANAAARTPFDDDEDASGGHTSYTSNSGPAMTQYGGYYATGPGSYDYESAGGYDPYAAAAAGAAGSTVGGAAIAGADPRGHNTRNSLVTDPGVAGVGGNERFAAEHGEHLAAPGASAAGGYPAGNESQYYLDPQEYDYDKTPENERYMDEPSAAGQQHHGGGMGYAEPYYPEDGHHAYGGQPMHGDEEVDYNGRRGLRVSTRCRPVEKDGVTDLYNDFQIANPSDE
ncbi:hypothetical protein QFC22_004487 [Naganishia vaughanmartiniae]|uniref:Uncharacterized protein n=1 Tax=Naganishia vaughanmartiniae TaxID=1424756 RepID=A0ACC2X1Y0_9TREE|nr:hypothetical protein QFC22_004487 [Naganishia vaughanmartiniae]